MGTQRTTTQKVKPRLWLFVGGGHLPDELWASWTRKKTPPLFYSLMNNWARLLLSSGSVMESTHHHSTHKPASSSLLPRENWNQLENNNYLRCARVSCSSITPSWAIFVNFYRENCVRFYSFLQFRTFDWWSTVHAPSSCVFFHFFNTKKIFPVFQFWDFLVPRHPAVGRWKQSRRSPH